MNTDRSPADKMKPEDRKRRIRAYKELDQEMGVVCIRCQTTGKRLVDAANNAKARLNRHKALLRMGLHENADVAADWAKYGESDFEFDVVDVLKPKDTPHYDPREDLAELREMWIERLELTPEMMY